MPTPSLRLGQFQKLTPLDGHRNCLTRASNCAKKKREDPDQHGATADGQQTEEGRTATTARKATQTARLADPGDQKTPKGHQKFGDFTFHPFPRDLAPPSPSVVGDIAFCSQSPCLSLQRVFPTPRLLLPALHSRREKSRM